MKDLFKNKPAGFYITLGSVGLTLVTALVHIICCNNTSFFSLTAFVLLLASVVGSIVLILLKKEKVAPYVLWPLNLVAFCFYAYQVYRYVFDVILGIDYDHFEVTFIVSTVFVLLSLIASTVTVFVKKTNEEGGVA